MSELFPVLQPEAAAQAAQLPLCRDVAWDYDSNAPLWARGAPVIVTGQEAVLGWAWRALHTPRFRHEMYTSAYGSELESLIGRAYSPELKTAEAARYLREALTINPYITGVDNITVEFSGGVLSVACSITTPYGESEVQASV